MGTHFTSRANRVTVLTTDEAQFVRAALGKYLRASLRGLLRPARRTPDSVRLEYDHERASLLAQAAKLSWDELIYGDPEIFRLERERIFARCWNYLAHESEIPDSGDYVLR